MSKSKLEILLEAIEEGAFRGINEAYEAYMEERKTLPQAGQEIEVWDGAERSGYTESFRGFCSNGRVITEIDKKIFVWKHYRIPTPKKKWKVVKDIKGHLAILSEDYQTDLPIITTFED